MISVEMLKTIRDALQAAKPDYEVHLFGSEAQIIMVKRAQPAMVGFDDVISITVSNQTGAINALTHETRSIARELQRASEQQRTSESVPEQPQWDADELAALRRVVTPTVYHYLITENAHSLAELFAYSDAELLRTPNLGRVSLRKFRAFQERYARTKKRAKVNN